MTEPVFTLTVGLPQNIRLKGRAYTREECFQWLWDQFGHKGLVGVHEGTILSEQAAEHGFETESFTVDAALAPRERDWVGDQGLVVAELYFDAEIKAQRAKEALEKIAPDSGMLVGSIQRQEPQDWNAVWKQHFKSVKLSPFWRVVPAWDTETKLLPGEKMLRLNPGAGFGTGTHETTQMCLEQLGDLAPRLEGSDVLDFGSGSGILTVAAAVLGARALGVEIDPLANDNATENASLNSVQVVKDSKNISEGTVCIQEEWQWARDRFDGVIANILRPVLVEFGPRLCEAVRPGGFVILSGLVEEDLSSIKKLFSEELAKKGFTRPPQVFSKDMWRAVVWK